MIYYLNVFIDIVDNCVMLTIPVKKVGGKPGIPGWNDFVEPFNERSLLLT